MNRDLIGVYAYVCNDFKRQKKEQKKEEKNHAKSNQENSIFFYLRDEKNERGRRYGFALSMEKKLNF